ncbi:MAG TPA: hypothetical protein VMS56_12770 [Thermoanaerobaculia bacterium]|nr:hypothetical protein [Thermoanaerobaculia bacterium]
MTRLALALALSLAAAAAFGASDLSISVNAPEAASHGQPFTYVLEARNAGPDAAPDVAVSIEAGGAPLAIVAPGWSCEGGALPFGTLVCRRGSLASGGVAGLQLDVIAPNSGASSSLRASISSAGTDPDAANDRATRTTTLTPSMVLTDLLVEAAAGARPAVPPGEMASFEVRVRNAGASPAGNVTLWVDAGEAEITSVSGAGWACQAEVSSARCRRTSLAAGETGGIAVGLRAPSRTTFASLFALAVMESATDPNSANNSRLFEYSVLPAAGSFDTILLPVLARATGGVFGSRWESELWVHVSPGNGVELFPRFEACNACPKPPPTGSPIEGGSTFEPRLLLEDAAFPPALLLYSNVMDRGRLSFNLRIRDLSRQSLTSGTEIPVVRGAEFFTGPVHLLNLPLEDGFRQMLRVYDPDARIGARVRIRIFPLEGSEALVDLSETLSVAPGNDRVTDLRLPLQPGYLEIGDFPRRFPQLAGTENVRVEVEPVAAGGAAPARIWAFVSITNNETQHVTTVTPQPRAE